MGERKRKKRERLGHAKGTSCIHNEQLLLVGRVPRRPSPLSSPSSPLTKRTRGGGKPSPCTDTACVCVRCTDHASCHCLYPLHCHFRSLPLLPLLLRPTVTSTADILRTPLAAIQTQPSLRCTLSHPYIPKITFSSLRPHTVPLTKRK